MDLLTYQYIMDEVPEAKKGSVTTNQTKPKCGIVMPISSIDGCSADHWAEVLTIFKDAIRDIGFEPNLVSESDEVGVIQKKIIQNLYNNEIVICDISGKNSNVMFELGMRLAFDKPTIVIKDDQTEFSFDTSPIEHITYPRDLRYSKILQLKDTLKKKIESTYKISKEDPSYTTFLKNFGEFKVVEIPEKAVSSEKYSLDMLEELIREVREIKRVQSRQSGNNRLDIKISPKALTDIYDTVDIKRFLTLTDKEKEEDIYAYMVQRKGFKDDIDDPVIKQVIKQYKYYILGRAEGDPL